jgi:hypothetical protein
MGEIWVAGAGVALGYLSRPELTAMRFPIDPLSGTVQYRSGDLGRLLPDGRLEQLGRIDNQVKIRGHRIEVDEIRVVLLEDPAVQSAVVVAGAHLDDPGDVRLHAYVVPLGNATTPGVRQRLTRYLPDHMVPATVTFVASLPLTANGKLDVGALPPSQAARLAESTRDEHASATVLSRVFDVWEQLFDGRVEPQDDFFELGGNSLLATRMSLALQAIGLPALPVRQLYRQPTPRGIAEYFEALRRP